MANTIEKTKEVRVQWSISADIECPHCGHDNDFMTIDDYYEFSKVGENKKQFIRPVEFTCEKCREEFLVNGSDF